MAAKKKGKSATAKTGAKRSAGTAPRASSGTKKSATTKTAPKPLTDPKAAPKTAPAALTPTRPFRLNQAPIPTGLRTYRDNVPATARAGLRDTPAGAPYVRKNQADLTADEQALLVSTWSSLIGSAFYGQLVSIHADMSHRMHSMDGPVGTQRFLPWHRAYLIQLETELKKLHPEVSLPYWNWVVDRAVPDWIANFLPTVQTADGQIIQVNRQPGVQAPDLPTQDRIDFVMSRTVYTDFTSRLEGQHNTVHMWVGGTMSLIPTAPADPIFWLHHAQIDRLWSVWQPTHAGQNPTLQGDDAILDPWTTTEPDTRSTQAMGYSYA